MVSFAIIICLIPSVLCIIHKLQHNPINKAILAQKARINYDNRHILGFRAQNMQKGIDSTAISQTCNNSHPCGFYTFVPPYEKRHGSIKIDRIVSVNAISVPLKSGLNDHSDQSIIKNDITSGNNPNRFAPSRFLEAPLNFAKMVGERMTNLLKPKVYSSGNQEVPSISVGKSSDEGAPLITKEMEYGTLKSSLKAPYVMDTSYTGLSFSQWPKDCFLRIRLTSYYKHLLNVAVENIKLGIEKHTNLQVTNTMAIPMRRRRWCYLSSPHIDKRSKDLLEIQDHVRILDIFPPKNIDSNNVKFSGLMMVPLPKLVSFDYWFEEAHKPVKRRKIDDMFRKRTWISKYYLYHRDKPRKEEIINKLTVPDLENEVPLKWKRRKCDYFCMQLGELKKLHKFVSRRKAEDDARVKYNIPTPVYHDFGDIRFIGNQEDRAFDGDINEEGEPVTDDESDFQ